MTACPPKKISKSQLKTFPKISNAVTIQNHNV